MQCKYIKRTIKAGNFIEIEKTQSYTYGKKIVRGKKTKPTPEYVKKINELNAAKNLKWLINANFGYNDIHAVPYGKIIPTYLDDTGNYGYFLIIL